MVIEDSNSGFQFFDSVCRERDIKCISAEGKSKIHKTLIGREQCETVIVADGAAFGSEMDKICKYMKDRDYVKLYLPESFEWIILKSGIVEVADLKAILNSPSDFIESKEFFSWEQYFTRLLTDNTQNDHLRYNKSRLNESYLGSYNKQHILHVMDRIEM